MCMILKSIACVCLLGVSLCSGKTRFVDETARLGLKLDRHQAAFVDYNNDGWVDIYSPPVLWENNSGEKFSQAAKLPGKGVWADFDNDGFADFFSYSSLRLFKNNAGEGFSEVKFPNLPVKTSLAACWADFNNDGFADIYIAGYENWKKDITFPDVLVLNKKAKAWDRAFYDKRFRARAVSSCDFDLDGAIDLYVSNYRLQQNLLWKNNGTGEFTDAAAEYNVQAGAKGFNGAHSISSAWADFDNDGNFDILAANFAHKGQPQSVFLRNTGRKNGFVFENKKQCGLKYQESFASATAADYDNDGRTDFFLTTVYKTASLGKKNYPVLYRNEGDWKFTDTTNQSGLSGLPPTYQAAWADVNNDGFLDLATAGKLFINQGGENSWIKVKLVGDGKEIDTCAIGSQARISLNNETLTRQIETTAGQGNQSQMTLHFGLGDRKKAFDIEIFWQNGETQTVSNVQPNRLITVKYK